MQTESKILGDAKKHCTARILTRLFNAIKSAISSFSAKTQLEILEDIKQGFDYTLERDINSLATIVTSKESFS